MLNSRVVLSVIAFLAAIMLIWLLVSLSVLRPIDFAAIGPFQFVYFVLVFVLYVYFWVYFYRRKRGSTTVVDGRTALSASAVVVGGATGYILIHLGVLVPWNAAELATGSFAVFVVLTVLPVLAWLAIFLNSQRRKAAARQGGAQP